MKQDSRFVSVLNSFLVLFIVLPSGFSKDYGDPRWNHEVLPEEEVIRIKGLLKDINFLLRDRSKNEWVSLKRDDPIPESAWVKGGDVKMIVHGYALKGKYSEKSTNTHKVLQSVEEKLEDQNIWELGLAYANANSSINVIIVDWLVLSTDTLGRYFEASEATRYVGEELARFLVRLAKDSYITDWDNVHVIGFSLGGHTVGVVGAKVQELVGVKVGRITGIDPAGPNFDNGGDPIKDFYRILDKSDAKFVDVIHCSMIDPQKSILGKFGIMLQSGHVDFYPDGGESQSLCTKKENRSTKPCSHMICCRYMAQSVMNPVLACPCDNWNQFKAGKCTCTLETGGVYMGDQCDKTKASGKYYVQMKK